MICAVYAPLDEGLPTSTVSIHGGPLVVAVWTCLMASKDQDGITRLTPDAIEALWSKSQEPRPLEHIKAAWDYLCSPDAKSANRDFEGRRLIPTGDGRWRLVSHEKYRDRHSGASYRAAAAERQRRRREKLKLASEPSYENGRLSAPVLFDENASGQKVVEKVRRETVGRDGGADPQAERGPAPMPGAARGESACATTENPREGTSSPEPAPPSGPTDPSDKPPIGVAPQETQGDLAPAPGPMVPPRLHEPTIQYPTAESRRAANQAAHEIAGWLEQYVGRTSIQVFQKASDYPGAGAMKTRAEMCSAPRLEATLVTLQGWRTEVAKLLVRGRVDPDAAWGACPTVGAAAPAVAPRNSQERQWDRAREILAEQQGLGPPALEPVQ